MIFKDLPSPIWPPQDLMVSKLMAFWPLLELQPHLLSLMEAAPLETVAEQVRMIFGDVSGCFSHAVDGGGRKATMMEALWDMLVYIYITLYN